MNKRIPVCEPFLNGNELKYVTEALETGWISSSGKYIQEFENAFSKYCDVSYGVCTTSGTAALHLALVTLGIGPGDEVIIPSFTMIATAFAVCYTGAMPVFVDADPFTWNMDIKKIEEKISKKTKAIMPVHIFGLTCDMDPILALAKKHQLFVVEDAAESHGALYKGKKAGSLSDIGVFSFFANKNITTGEGGMMVTANSSYAQKAKYYKNLCFPTDGKRTYLHEEIGFNYRLSNLHAALGLAQVEKADEYKEMRIKNAALYRQSLANVPGIVFQQYDAGIYENVFWMNAVKIDPKLFEFKIYNNEDQKTARLWGRASE
jgi:perosamine synthetase